jgi:hypothetical protein
MRIRLLRSAYWDLDDGYAFYESREAGLGDYYLSSVKADIEGFRVSAGIHRIVYEDYHRMLCRTFPFAVFYSKENSTVTIYSVVDCRRDPLWIRQHVQGIDEPND